MSANECRPVWFRGSARYLRFASLANQRSRLDACGSRKSIRFRVISQPLMLHIFHARSRLTRREPMRMSISSVMLVTRHRIRMDRAPVPRVNNTHGSA